MRAASATLLIASTVLIARAAAAAPLPTRLELHGVDGCPTEQGLRDAVAVRLGTDPFAPSGAQRLVADVRRTAEGRQGYIQLWSAEETLAGERTLTGSGDDCRAFTEALALAISIALDPFAPLAPPVPVERMVLEPKGQGTLGPAVPPVDGAPAPIAARAEVAREQPASVPALRLGLGMTGGLGAAPSASFGLTLVAELLWAHFSLGLAGRDDLPASATLAGGGQIQTALRVGELLPCARVGPFGICLVAALGSETANVGGSLVDTHVRSAFFSALGGRVFGELTFYGPLGGQLAAEAWAPLSAQSVQVGGGTVWSSSAVAGALSASLFWIHDESETHAGDRETACGSPDPGRGCRAAALLRVLVRRRGRIRVEQLAPPRCPPSDLEDQTHEVFVIAFRALSRFDPGNPLRPLALRDGGEGRRPLPPPAAPPP